MKYIVCSILLIISTCVIQGQNSITVSNKSTIYLDLTQTFNPGSSKKTITDNSQWLNYTTLVHPSDPKMSITVEVASGMVPDGMELLIEASPYVGMSKSKQGNSIGKISISHTPRVLINNIGTCYTGSNRNEGHQITYSFIITDYAKVRSGKTNLYIQYTITQH